jgi:hypothetical protein
VDAVLVIEAGGGSERETLIGGVRAGFAARGPAWAPDGARLAVVIDPPFDGSGGPTELRLYGADGGLIRALAGNGAPGTPDWR